MHSLNTIKFIAACAVFTLANTGFAHENQAHKAAGLVKKEQKDWGIAGDANTVTRTITITMSDAMRFTPNRITVKRGETVIFSWIVYKSRAHRDRVMALAMKDPRMARMMNSKTMPFDGKRMIYGGFKTLIAFGA